MKGKKSRKDSLDLATRAIHAASGARSSGSPVAPPIIQSATFMGGGPGESGPLRYTRYGDNPTLEMVGAKVAALEGMEAGVPLGSGMAAISLALLALTRTEDHILASNRLYGATLHLLREELPRRGVETTLVDADSPREWRRGLKRNTRLIYLELPANPTLRVPDPGPPAILARETGLPLVMDTTFATPMNFRGGEHGADVVLHSATKYLGGHSDLSAGVACGSREFVSELLAMLRSYGAVLDPHAAWLLDRGIRTLPVRMERHNASALELARWFEEQPEVKRVDYPGLPSHPDHALASKILSGFGGMLSIQLKGDDRGAEAFCRVLRLALVAPSLGGVETLVSLPHLTSHRGTSASERKAMGIPRGYVRISVGLEGVTDLRRDFRRGLDAVKRLLK